MSRGCPPPGPHLALLGLLLALNPGCAGDKGISNFFKPLRVQQRRNAGILGGSCAGAALLFLSIFIGCKLKGSQAKEKPSSEWKDRDMADFLMKLMDKSDDSDEEEEEQVQKRLQETE
ncbi:transmembrane protein 190 precursor isoform B [Alligator mississippiensis]|uniref:Transmembrane protein 190 isoform B n=2 Tax=Alligator mississippiensis TaxID=8496 RepID=A0A151MG82_ALLMI|nr:transmembrane protein 190 precursor isoform B [Alligator mississippiensis]